MAQKLNNHKTGLALGAFFALFALLGLWQKFLDRLLILHKLLPFNLVNAIILVVVASAAGYSLGFVFATIWNRIAK